MWILSEATPPTPPLIQTVIEAKQEAQQEEVELPKIYTIDEKIAMNYYNCDEAVEYIRADDATCLSKHVIVPSSTNTQVSRENTPEPIKSGLGLITAPAGWYPVNQCTHYVWTKRPVGRWNNASEWYRQAKRDGWATGTTPQAGAIGVQKSGNHVVYIEAVDGDRVYISERNHDFKGSYREKWEAASKYNYIY